MTKNTHDVFGINNEVASDSYVDRGELDRSLARLLSRNTHIALRGESKCGKSWLRQKMVPNAIVVQCRLGRTVTDIYIDALSQLDIQLLVQESSAKSFSARVEAQGALGESLLAKVLGLTGSVGGGINGEHQSGKTQQSVGRDINDLKFVADLIKESGKRLVIEDFHYLSVDERRVFAFDLKALWDYGLFIMIIGVWSQSNMLIDLNPDLTARIEELSIYWSPEDLEKIMVRGGGALNLRFSDGFKKQCVRDSYGNSGILQSLVLKALDELNIEEKQLITHNVDDMEALESAALQYAEQLNALYQQFAKRVSGGIRKRADSTGIYAHAMAVILESEDALAIKGIHIDYLFEEIHAREPRVQKGNLKTILGKFEELQVDDDGRGLVIAYNEATNEVSIVDRALLLYRRYSTVTWPWEELVAEVSTQTS